MSVEDRFNAAVEIIRSLPKNGSFQPPYAMQLSFYSHFKQATSGPCSGARPSFWDVVGRAKFDAWQALGSMEKTEAQEKYVSEFVNTIKQLQAKATAEEVTEALSYAEPKHIALFKPLFGDVANNANVPAELRGSSANSDDDIEKIEANFSDAEEEYSDTFHNLDEERNSPEQADIVNERVLYKNLKNQKDVKVTNVGGGAPSKQERRPVPLGPYVRTSRDPFPHSETWTGQPNDGSRVQIGAGGRQPGHSGDSIQPVDNLSYAVVRLQYTMDEVIRRLDKLEKTLHEQQTRKWSLFGGVQPHILIAIFSWPVIVQFIIYYIRQRRVRVQLHLK